MAAVTAARPLQRDQPQRGKTDPLILLKVEPFKAETFPSGGVLTYKGFKHIVLKASAEGMQLMQGKLAGRPPFAYEFIPVPDDELFKSVGSAPRSYPIIRIVAAPGVAITFENWPRNYPFFDSEHPMVQIFRVQDPAQLPEPGQPIDPFRYGPGGAVDPAKRPGATILEQSHIRVLTFPRPDGVDFIYHDPMLPRSEQSKRGFSVTAPELLGDARFAYEVVGPSRGEPIGSVGWRTWTIKLVKTPSVEVKAFGLVKGEGDFLDEEIYEVSSVKDVPKQGEPIQPVGKLVTHWAAQVEVPTNWSAVFLDTAISMIPIVGSLYDVAQIAYGIATGEDFWGQPLTNTDLAIMGAAAIMPFSPGKKLSQAIAKLGRGAERSTELARLVEVATEAQKARIKGWEGAIRAGKEFAPAERKAMVGTLEELNAAVAKAGRKEATKAAGKAGEAAAEKGAKEAAEAGTKKGAKEATSAGARAVREASERAAREGAAKAGKALTAARQWAADTLGLSAGILKDLTLDAIERLKKLPQWAMERLRELNDLAKRAVLGCTSPCRVNLDKIMQHLKSLEAAPVGPKLTDIKAVVAALPKGLNSGKIEKYLSSHPALMKAITETGLTADHFAALKHFVTWGDSNPLQAYRTFVRYLTHVAPAHLHGDIKAFNDLAEALVKASPKHGSALKGSMFETFMRTHPDFAGISFTRGPTFPKGGPLKLAKGRISDFYDAATKTVWDFKHTGKVDPKQLDDYVKILGGSKDKVKQICYVFPSKEFAEANVAAKAAGIMLYYVDQVGKLRPLP